MKRAYQSVHTRRRRSEAAVNFCPGWVQVSVIDQPWINGGQGWWQVDSTLNNWLTEITVCRLNGFGVHLGIARVCPSVQRALAAPDCTPWMPAKGSNTLRAFCLLLRLGYVGGSNIESDYYLSESTMRSDWFFLVLVTFWQIVPCSLQTKTNKKCVL